MKKSIILSGALTALLCIYGSGNVNAQCKLSLLTNSSFNSIEGEAVTAPGWNSTSTPDVNDENGPLNCTPCYVWVGIPLASPDGGTWQNIYGNESISQIPALTAGQPYSLCFQYAAQGIVCSSQLYDGPVGINIYLNSVLSFTTPIDFTQYTWETACFFFTPTTSLTEIRFETTSQNYVGIDGVCLTETITTSVEGNGNVSVKVSGNVVTDEFSITSAHGDMCEIILYDMHAAKVMQREFTGSLTMNTSQLQRGIYFYELRRNNSVIKKDKLIKL
ncbi:MAG TPA: T9SS type A sorting domain-containing protein [Bacteroidia bacterium]|nr:T9SS type A sorting domain-containing protein [Bacteroidia bacterium]